MLSGQLPNEGSVIVFIAVVDTVDERRPPWSGRESGCGRTVDGRAVGDRRLWAAHPFPQRRASCARRVHIASGWHTQVVHTVCG